MPGQSQSGVYVRDEHYGWLPARILSSEDETKVVNVEVTVPVIVPRNADSSDEQTDTIPDDCAFSYVKQERKIQLKDYEAETLPLQNMDESGNGIVVPDMCDLPSLHEAAILYNLKSRHEALSPYTRTGDIVIAMNPFQWISELYTDAKRQVYTDQLINENVKASGDPKEGLEPHVYEVSALAYRGLAQNSTHQSILVSGESGAGKTETVKIIMSHLASVNQDNVEFEKDNLVVKRVLDSNPLLEAFGNAKTIRNDNSSRFGKFIQLQFDVEDATTAAYAGKNIPSCMLAGSTCETYLLEKSRVVGHDSSERTYHIFYQLLAAPEETKLKIWDGLRGTSNTSFQYVGETDTTVIEKLTDGERWEKTVDALNLIGISGDTFKDLMRAICIVMQLGNLTFDEDPSNDDGSVITSEQELAKLSALMGIDGEHIEKALTYRTIHAAKKETYSVPLRSGMARDSRDAFAKAIYQHTFEWLVKQINIATCAEENYSDTADVEEYGHIGLLDIFGFETFQVNRFEQFSINYANEKLQQKYNLDIFSSVQTEYEYEGIELPAVDFSDNSEVLHLVEGRMGLISMLNEECLRPHGNDSSFVSKIKTVNTDIGCLVKDPLLSPTQFAISHYAGKVVYEASNFVQKNTDRLPNDLVQCVARSSNMLIKTEFAEVRDIVSAGSSGKGMFSSQTVASKFRSQLHSLMQTIQKTTTRYVRCIKPNPKRKPKEIDLLSSVQQLRCAGVVAAVTISRVSYPNRLPHESVLDRFSCISSNNHHQFETDNQNAMNILMKDALSDFDGESESHACGKSRIYFKAGALEFLESKRMHKLGVLATSVQRIIRGFVQRSTYLTLRDTSIYLQSLARRNKARSTLMRACFAVTTISCWVRCVRARKELHRLRQNRAITMIQTRYRIMSAKKLLMGSISSAIVIQKIWRGSLQRPVYRTMLAEAEEEARVNSKIAALQKRLADAEMKWIKADKARIQAENKASSADVDEEKKFDDRATADGSKELLDESNVMIDYLKKENFKLRSSAYLLKTDLNEVKLRNAHLSEQYGALHDSDEAVRQHAAEMSNANFKLNAKNIEFKKKYHEAKKTLKEAMFEHKSDLKKLKDLMKAKDEDNALEISRLRAELSAAKLGDRREVSRKGHTKLPTINTSQHGQKKKNGSRRSPKPLQIDTKTRATVKGRKSPNMHSQINPSPSTYDDERSPKPLQISTKTRATIKGRKSPNMHSHNNPSPSTHDDERSPKPLQINTKTRATIKGRKSPNMHSQINPSPSTHDDERWGHDGFFELVKENSPSNSSNNNSSNEKKSRNRKSRKQRTPTSNTNSGAETNVVSPDAPKSSSMHREASQSSLALAASKPSSLAERARKN